MAKVIDMVAKKPALPVILATVFASSGASAQSAEEAYRSRYMVAGFFIRAGNVCGAGGKRMIEAAFKSLQSEEIKAVSRSFPAATEKWMTEGAGSFNSTAMKVGIFSACASATAELKQIEDTDERLQSSGSSAPAAIKPKTKTKLGQDGAPPQDWQSLEAINGAVYKYNRASIDRLPNGTAMIMVFAAEGSCFRPQNLRRLWFDCRESRYKDITQGSQPQSQYVAPRSVAGQFLKIACGSANPRASTQP